MRTRTLIRASSLCVVLSFLPTVLVLGQDASDIAPRFQAGMKALAGASNMEEGKEREAALNEAIGNFRSILVNNPELVRVRLELAHALFLKGKDTLARRHFEQVLAGNLPPAVALNVARFLRDIRARRKWIANFGMAVAPDSNPDFASGDKTVWVDTAFGRIPFILDNERNRKSDLGILLWGGGEYQHPVSPRLRLRAGVDAVAREYQGRRYDRHSLAAFLGPRWLVNDRTEASLLATAERQWLGRRPGWDLYGLRLEGEHVLTPRLALQARLGLQYRNYLGGGQLDGPLGDVAMGTTWAVLPVLRVFGEAGYEMAHTRSASWRNKGPFMRLGANLDLPAGFTLRSAFSLQKLDYLGDANSVSALDGKPRQDHLETISVSVHNRALSLFGFSPSISLVRERRATNAQTLDFKRNRAELSLIRLF